MSHDLEHTGFGNLIGQRKPFGNAATEITEKIATASEAIDAAGLGWSVAKRPLWFTGTKNGSKPVKVLDAFAMVKEDDEQYLGTVGKQYHGIQNLESFDWMDEIEGHYAAGGAMRNNRQVYLIKEVPTHVLLGGTDETSLFLFGRTSHDGTKSLQCIVSPVRVHCMNMMPLVQRESINRFAVRHVSSYAEKIEQARKITGLTSKYVDELAESTARLAETEIDMSEFEKMINEVMPRRVELRDGIMSNLQNSTTIDDSQRGTCWGALNAATEYLEWGRDVTSNTHRLQANLDGQGARFRNALTVRLLAKASA